MPLNASCVLDNSSIRVVPRCPYIVTRNTSLLKVEALSALGAQSHIAGPYRGFYTGTAENLQYGSYPRCCANYLGPLDPRLYTPNPQSQTLKAQSLNSKPS